VLSREDKWGAFKVRFAWLRMSYMVDPGLYAVGNPDKESLVFVTANYKLSFDILRSELSGLDAFILVLDTKGINVWCAAGKGSFGTMELMNRIHVTKLREIVDHRKLILPQLGAVGIAAPAVSMLSGFTVIYGPVRARDIKAFLNASMKATPEMRLVKFTFRDRFKLVPVEFIQGLKYLAPAALIFFILGGLSKSGFSQDLILKNGAKSIMNLLLALISGAILGPVLLPWLPGRSFSLKGVFPGIVLFLFSQFIFAGKGGRLELVSWLLIMTAISSFTTMNFTGASTFTSLSGVRREMRYAVPAQISAGAVGMLTWIMSRFI
jgi:acetyl-CoA decarbonylase/synthase complex subunit gamma